jgi:hypothetical protein
MRPAIDGTERTLDERHGDHDRVRGSGHGSDLRFTVQDRPVTVVVDSEGRNVHVLTPAEWRGRIAREGLLEEA